MFDSMSDDQLYSSYFVSDEVLLHIVVPDPSDLYKGGDFNSNDFLSLLQKNHIVQASQIISAALNNDDDKDTEILTFHLPPKYTTTVDESTVVIKKEERIVKRGRVTIHEHVLIVNEERITTFEDIPLELYAIVWIKVNATDDVELINHLRTLDSQIGVNKSSGFPVECGQYAVDKESGKLPLVRSFSPNWYVGAYPNLIPGGGPAGLPVPPQNPVRKRFRFKNTSPLPHLGQQIGLPVEVFILDTIPDPQICQNAFRQEQQKAQAAAANNPANPMVLALLAENNTHARADTVGNSVLDRYYIDPALLPPGPDADPTHGAVVGCVGEDISDHGTFIASIIHSIAPTAKLHLIQTLNKYGVGTARSLYHGLIRALTSIPSNPSTPVLVNCSLGFRTPRPTDIVNQFAVNRRAKQALIDMSADPDFEKYVLDTMITCEDIFYSDHLLTTLTSQLTSTSTRPQLVIAAAGNDWNDPCNPPTPAAAATAVPRPGPRYPAYSNYVLGVGALDHNDQLTNYSNIADEPQPSGLWTFGGEIVHGTTHTDPNSSLVGMYISPTFPDAAHTPNRTQLACWSGTSFSTAVITGIVASTLSQNGKVRDIINNTGSIPGQAGVKTLLVEQIP